jgi:hypothetical protein
LAIWPSRGCETKARLACLIPIVTAIVILAASETIGIPRWATLLVLVPFLNLVIMVAVGWRLCRVVWGYTYEESRLF